MCHSRCQKVQARFCSHGNWRWRIRRRHAGRSNARRRLSWRGATELRKCTDNQRLLKRFESAWHCAKLYSIACALAKGERIGNSSILQHVTKLPDELDNKRKMTHLQDPHLLVPLHGRSPATIRVQNEYRGQGKNGDSKAKKSSKANRGSL